jgi:amidohydrolase family protein
MRPPAARRPPPPRLWPSIPGSSLGLGLWAAASGAGSTRCCGAGHTRPRLTVITASSWGPECGRPAGGSSPALPTESSKTGRSRSQIAAPWRSARVPGAIPSRHRPPRRRHADARAHRRSPAPRLRCVCRPVSQLEADDDATLLLRTRLAAQRALAAGITTIRDLGDRSYVSLALRDWSGAGHETGPRILASGAPITITGGHCWFLGGEADGADLVRHAVRERIARGVDVIKVMASGGNMTPARGRMSPNTARLSWPWRSRRHMRMPLLSVPA